LRVRLQLARLSHEDVVPSIPAYLTISIKVSVGKRSKAILERKLRVEIL